MRWMWCLMMSFFLCAPIFGMHVQIYDSPEALGEACARQVAELIREKPNAVLGLATGSTPIPFYQALKKIVQEENLDLSQVITFNLDEYVGLSPEHPSSYHAFMQEQLFAALPGMDPAHIYIPNAYAKKEKHLCSGELQALYRAFPTRKKGAVLSNAEEIFILKQRVFAYEKALAEFGPIDIQILGIGTNGHIGFAEPGASFEERTCVVQLAENTRKDNARFFDGDIKRVPKYAMTMGIKTILEAKKIFLMATGKNKAHIIRDLLHEDISTAIPATALRLHADAHLYLDRESVACLSENKVTRFSHGRILRNHKIQEEDLWVCNGKVIAPQTHVDEEIDSSGCLIAPGYIDLQINGGFGVDFSMEPEKVEKVAEKLPCFGVTAFLPTIISSSKEEYRSILSSIRPKIMKSLKGASILGVHLEGPFFNPIKTCAHNPHYILSGDKVRSAVEVYGDLCGVKIVTLAPEIEGAAHLITELKNQGIVVSAGHTCASYEEMKEAAQRGVRFATHLFNGMPSFHHRNPGIIGSVLVNPKLPFSLIGDPNHLHPQTVALAWNCNPDGLVLISDAMAALGLPPGQYTLGIMDVEVKEGKAMLTGTETLAGSVIHLSEAVRYLRECTGCSMEEAIEAASYKPAKILGIESKKGSLHVGADADFNILDDQLNVLSCYVGGVCCFQQPIRSRL